MKRFLMLLIAASTIFAFNRNAAADLLDRVRLEDALRLRLEQIVQLKDPKAHVLARAEFKSYKSELPGTTVLGDDASPAKLELSDITRLDVQVYTELTDLPADTRDMMLKLIPIGKDRVKISTTHVESSAPQIVRKTVEAKDLSEIAQQSVHSIENLSKIVLGGLAALIVLALGVSFVYSSRKMKELKDQFALLAQAISEGGGAGRAAAAIAQMNSQTSSSFAGASSAAQERELANLPAIALRELFADSYWCEADGYAHWLWKKLGADQRADLLAHLPFMSDYALFFVQTDAFEKSYHEHPYYLKPVSCAHVSMNDTNKALAKDLTLWHRLSPLRQISSTLTLEQKLKAVQSHPSGSFTWSNTKPSALRTLEAQARFGEISSADETLLFESPSLAPESMKSNIRTLVWLAHRDDTKIKKVLAKYDARTLASAWVGAEVVLKKLETQLPEKKLKLLQMYRERQTPSRTSPVYQSLVEEGLQDESA